MAADRDRRWWSTRPRLRRLPARLRIFALIPALVMVACLLLMNIAVLAWPHKVFYVAMVLTVVIPLLAPGPDHDF